MSDQFDSTGKLNVGKTIVPFPGSGLPQTQEPIGSGKYRDVGRGRMPRRMRKPVIYFAGRMDGSHGGTDWRDAVEGFDGLHTTDLIHCDTVIDSGSFRYGGPFIVGNTGGFGAHGL